MSKKVKIWLVTAVSLVLVGGVIFGVAMTKLKWDFTKLSTTEYETNVHTVGETFQNISISTDTADIVFVATDEQNCKVECFEEKKEKHSVYVTDGTLVIKAQNTKKWYDYVGINFKNAIIKVYLPKGVYGDFSVKSYTGDVTIPKGFTFEKIDICGSTSDVTNAASASENIKIKTSTGDITLEKVNAESIDLTVSTGEIVLSDAKCNNFLSSGNTGNLFMNKVVAKEKITVKRDTGDINFEKTDASEIFIQTDTGNVCGSLLSEKVFIALSDTGRVDVPKSVNGGRCEIITDTGDIEVNIE